MLDGFTSVISVDCGVWRTVMSNHDPIFDMNCQNILAFGEIRFLFGNQFLLNGGIIRTHLLHFSPSRLPR